VKIIYVDGYNLINNWPELINQKKASYEAARQKLIEMLQNYGAFIGSKIIIVFDAHKVRGSIQKKEKYGELIVIFTKEGETADSYIEKSVNDLGRRVNVTVVTNDNLEQQVVFQRGAVRKSCFEFYTDVVKGMSGIQNKTIKVASKERNLLSEFMDDNVYEKLEKIRRSH